MPMMESATAFDWHGRSRTAGIHLSASLVVATGGAALVFGLWLPWPYRTVSGGTELFALLVGVDVVVGPLITLAIFDRRKPRSELRRDLTIVVLLQIAALSYGLRTTYLARPVALALEGERFRVVAAVEIVEEELALAPERLRRLSLVGPRTVATVPPKEGSEQLEAITMALAGADLGMRPRYWREWGADARWAALARAKPLAAVARRSPSADAAIAQTGRDPAALVWLPLLARRDGWAVLLDASTGKIAGFAPLQGG